MVRSQSSRLDEHIDAIIFEMAIDFAYHNGGYIYTNSLYAKKEKHILRYGLALFNEDNRDVLGRGPLPDDPGQDLVRWLISYDPLLSTRRKSLEGTCYIAQTIQFPNDWQSKQRARSIEPSQLLKLPINWAQLLEHNIRTVKLYPESKSYCIGDIILDIYQQSLKNSALASAKIVSISKKP